MISCKEKYEMYKSYYSGLCTLIVLIQHICCEPTEYCNGNMFEPVCDNDEIIIIKSALYGRMRIGQCVPRDLGFVGCSSNVLPYFDEVCSGHQSCEIQVIDKNIEGTGGCFDGLKLYLEADFECHKALDIDDMCTSTEIEIERNDVMLSSLSLKPCMTNNRRHLSLNAKDGQVLNISMVSLSQSMDTMYGSIQDTSSGKSVVLGTGARHQQVMISTGSNVHITLQEYHKDSNFILKFHVSGCADITPPDGAWMIRERNQMEIGCHSGAKSWSLKCENNKWVGALGLCGSVSDDKLKVEQPRENVSAKGVSPNVLLFGGSSIIILISAVIFLVGVCILRRKLQCNTKRNPVNLYTHGKPDICGNTALLNHEISLRKNNGQQSKVDRETLEPLNTPPAYSVYANTCEPDASGSVKYYVLENTNHTAVG